MLRREFGGKLGQNGDEYIGYAIQGALRMEQLLGDLRAYALASSAGQEPTEDIDADQILDKALANLETAIEDSGASIIIDLNLPKKPGREVLERMRLSERCRYVPVVILSSSDAERDRADAARWAASIRKPSRLDEFLKLGAIFKAALGLARE